jgi:hypothetical protein
VRDCPEGGEWILDNGAFPAWRKGEPLNLTQQIDGLAGAMEAITPTWVIAPDVIGDAKASLERTKEGTRLLEIEGGGRWLLALQEGADIPSYCDLAADLSAGLFVGGARKRWKRRTLERVRAHDKKVWVHVGRISKARELHHAALMGANAFDTTTFLRQQDKNKSIQWRERFERYVAPQTDGAWT